MTYYMYLPGDDPKDAIHFDSNLLGEVSFKNFWTGTGWKAFKKIVNLPEIANQVTIKSQTGKAFTIDTFLDELKGLKIIEGR